jgi:competence protein ComEC
MSDRLFYQTFISFILGIGLYTLKNTNYLLISIFLFIFLIYIKIKFKLSLKNSLVHIVLCLVLICTGFIYAYLREPAKPSFQNDSVVVSGKIIGIPDDDFGKTSYTLRVKNNGNSMTSYDVLLAESTYAKRQMGETAQVEFEVLPLESNSKNSKNVNYIEYLLAKNITAKGKVIKYQKIKDPSKFLMGVNNTREYINKTFNNFMAYPESGLASGLILGNKSWMDNGLYNDFIKSGTIHIVALSGYNISVLVKIIRDGLIYFLPAIFIEYILIIFIALFLLMTGFSVTGLRAGLMAMIIIVTRSYGLMAQKDRLLVIAGTLLLLWRPYSLWYDLSFQLSIIATFSVLFLAPIVELKYLYKIKNNFLRDLFATTIAATVFTMPIIMYSVNQVSLVSLFANLIIGPIVPIVTGLNLGLIFTSFITPLAYVVGGISSVLHGFVLFVTHFFATLPFAQIQIGMPAILLVIIYTAFVWWVIREYKKLEI